MKRLLQSGPNFWKRTVVRASLFSLIASGFAAHCLAQVPNNDSTRLNKSPALPAENPPTLRGEMPPTSAIPPFIGDPPDWQPKPADTTQTKRDAKSKRVDATKTNRVEAPSINGDMLDAIGKQPLDVPNFFMVNRGLLRGGQPTAQGFRLLKQAGVKTVIDLRTEEIPIQREKDMVSGNDMKFISMPVYLFEEPTPEQFKLFLATVQNPANQPVFVHCQQGRDRTGTMIGAYRVAANGWKAQAAYKEMYDKGFRPGFAPLMQGFYKFAAHYDKTARAPTGDYIVRDLKTRFDRLRGKEPVPPAGSQQIQP